MRMSSDVSTLKRLSLLNTVEAQLDYVSTEMSLTAAGDNVLIVMST